MSQSDTLVSNLMKAKHFSSSGNRYLWKSLCGACLVLKEGMCWAIGDGANISVYPNTWTKDRTLVQPSEGLNHVPLLRVEALIQDDSKTWNVDVVNYSTDNSSQATILATPLFKVVRTNIRIW